MPLSSLSPKDLRGWPPDSSQPPGSPAVGDPRQPALPAPHLLPTQDQRWPPLGQQRRPRHMVLSVSQPGPGTLTQRGGRAALIRSRAQRWGCWAPRAFRTPGGNTAQWAQQSRGPGLREQEPQSVWTPPHGSGVPSPMSEAHMLWPHT